MTRKQKKKSQVAEEEPKVEVITKVEVIYEDNKATTSVEPEYKWGEVYRMISSQSVLDVGFEDMPMYANIERSTLMKVATRPDLFPCSKVIGWILLREDVTRMILANIEKQGYATYRPDYVSMAYHLPTPQTYLSEGWLKESGLDLVETVKKMMIPGRNFRTRPFGEYETSTLRAP